MKFKKQYIMEEILLMTYLIGRIRQFKSRNADCMMGKTEIVYFPFGFGH